MTAGWSKVPSTRAIDGRGSATLLRLEEVAVIALAAQRLARVISTDAITAPLRRRVDDLAARANGRVSARAARALAELLACPVCTGWWSSLAVSAAWPGRARFRRGLSVAGMQVLLALVERLVSEHGRSAIHVADIRQAQSRAVESRRDIG
jgi:hypothetical protein